jgi:Fur family ferric uptake transcriptional regulator
MGRPAVVSHRILEVLTEKHALSAPDLLMVLEKSGTQVNKTSIYRALEKLTLDGIICKQTLNGETLVYELRDHHHDHLVCEKCGLVQKIPCLTKAPKAIDGFEVHHHHTTIFGLCSNCH